MSKIKTDREIQLEDQKAMVKAVISKDAMFILANELMSLDEEIREKIMNLTVLLNQQKNDNYFIPKSFISTFTRNKEEQDIIYDKLDFIKNVSVLENTVKQLSSKEKQTLLSEIRNGVLQMRDSGSFEFNSYVGKEEFFGRDSMKAYLSEGNGKKLSESYALKLMSMNKSKE